MNYNLSYFLIKKKFFQNYFKISLNMFNLQLSVGFKISEIVEEINK